MIWPHTRKALADVSRELSERVKNLLVNLSQKKYMAQDRLSMTYFSGRTDSIYLRLREKNLCNHRDYHNLARSGSIKSVKQKYFLELQL